MARAPALREIELLPEADRLDEFPHPRETEKLYGHADACKTMAASISDGRIHHGWLIAGHRGIGKATFAYHVAQFALSSPADRSSDGGEPSFQNCSITRSQVRAMSHPGLLVIRRRYDTKTKRFSTSIRIDDVRQLREFLARSAEADAWRVVIVDSADELNINAANALLKSLEEPPPRTLFLLITSRPGRLLATIRSRCRRLDLHPLQPEDLRKAVDQASRAAGIPAIDDASWSKLSPIADGSVRRYLALQSAGGLELYEQAWNLVSELNQSNWPKIHALADQLAPVAAAEQFGLFVEMLSNILARLIRARAGEFGSDAERQLAQSLIAEPQLASWAGLWETIGREKARIDTLNLDRKSFLLETFVRLEAQARQPQQ